MSLTGLGLALMVWLQAAVPNSAPDHAPAPGVNVVVFLVDDLGWQDVSVPHHEQPTPFNQRYHTPNLERLAAQGVVLTNGYASAPVCSPTRTSLLTGWTPARTRITYWLFNKDSDTTARNPRLTAPPWRLNGLEPDPVLLPEVLSDRGYRTIHIGKAHWGAHGTPGSDPTELGFDVNVAGHASGAPGSYLSRHHFMNTKSETDFSRSSKWDVPGLEAFHDRDLYLTEALQERMVEEIEQAVNDGQPFFLHFAPYAVHTPIMANEAYLDRYSQLPPREAAYATMIESVDAALGGLLDVLDEQGIAERTLVVFTSDNGGLSAHARDGVPHTHNLPLRSGKGSAYEGGVRVPWVVRWPGVVPAGTRSDQPVVTQDLYPTILAATGPSHAGPRPAAARQLDGIDLAPILSGRPAPLHSKASDRVILFHQPHTWGARGPGIEPYSAIRWRQWKLIYFHGDRRFELYDLDSDLGESQDLSHDRPEVLEVMITRLAAELRQSKAQMSIDTVSGKPVEWPDEVALSSDPTR